MRAGYVDLYLPHHPIARGDGYVAEHRQVAFDAGLLTDLGDHVHHVNGVRSDNRLENLEVLSPREHTLRHQEESGTVRNGLGEFKVGQGFRRQHAARVAALGDRACQGCGADLTGYRTDAVVCGSTCRVRVWKGRRLGVEVAAVREPDRLADPRGGQ